MERLQLFFVFHFIMQYGNTLVIINSSLCQVLGTVQETVNNNIVGVIKCKLLLCCARLIICWLSTGTDYSEMSLAVQVLSDTAKKKDNMRY